MGAPSTNMKHSPKRTAFTLMELLVCIAIIIILCSIAYPIYIASKRKAHGVAALKKMNQLGVALNQYVSANNGLLPKENTDSGENSWHAAALPDAADVWYNALPRLAGTKGTGDYSTEGNAAGFYANNSLLALEGVEYPNTKMRQPFYAFAFNTKLHRKDATTGEKPRVKLSRIADPSRVVAFLEQGVKGEKRPMEGMQKYAGDDSKASGKQFVARWSNKGILVFLDGHAELVKATDILENAGGLNLKWNATDASAIRWCVDASENPN